MDGSPFSIVSLMRCSWANWFSARRRRVSAWTHPKSATVLPVCSRASAATAWALTPLSTPMDRSPMNRFRVLLAIDVSCDSPSHLRGFVGDTQVDLVDTHARTGKAGEQG